MISIRPLLFAASVLFSLGSLAGCGASGPKFTSVDLGPNESVIYIYKKSEWGGGEGVKIVIDDVHVTSLKSNGYYPHVTTPGVHEVLFVEDVRHPLSPISWLIGEVEHSKLTLHTQPGRAYYIKDAGLIDLELIEVSELQALDEIQSRRLLSPAKSKPEADKHESGVPPPR